ncbi:hypothetical protein ACTWP5_18930 [Streptomyces sp. 4N509B]|uniref:hypothetical protein n=1 Tax=Streptomyces sp. 4N509B TaxID=3457413 RepID=UPI003FD67DCD
MITTLGIRGRSRGAAGGRAAWRRRRGRAVRLLVTMAGVALVGLASSPAAATPGQNTTPAATLVAAPAEPCDPVEDFGCIPEPVPLPEDGSTTEPGGEETDELEEGGGGPGGFAGWVLEGVTAAINGFFADLASAALDPLLDVLGRTLLVTPTPDELPQVDVLWSRSWQIAVACYSLLVTAAGLIVMGHQTVQTQHSAREIAPRIVVGFLASFLSLWVATRMIVLANGLSQALMSDSVEVEGTANVLKGMINGSLASDGMFTVFIGLVIAAFGLTIIVSYVVRVALTVIMIAGAPLALACHALPQTESIARWWWRAFAGLLAIQVAQSLTLVAALNVFLGPEGFQVLGGGHTGLINLSVALALFYILFKIPAWILAATRLPGGGRSLAGSAARTYLAYKTFGLLRGGATAARAGKAAGAGGGRGWQARPRGTSTARAASVNAPPARGRGLARRPPGPPAFRQPVPASAAPRPRRAAGAPGMPRFQAPVPDQRPTAPPRRVDVSPGPPLFLSPRPDPANRASTPSPGRPAPVAPRPHFRAPERAAAPPPRRAAGPAPAATFRSPTPPSPAVNPPPQLRRHPPPPATFRPPPPPPAPR